MHPHPHACAAGPGSHRTAQSPVEERHARVQTSRDCADANAVTASGSTAPRAMLRT